MFSLVLIFGRISPGCHFDLDVGIRVIDILNDGVELISCLCPDFFGWSVVRKGEGDIESRVGSTDVDVDYSVVIIVYVVGGGILWGNVASPLW